MSRTFVVQLVLIGVAAAFLGYTIGSGDDRFWLVTVLLGTAAAMVPSLSARGTGQR
jgi:hypothetical protein